MGKQQRAAWMLLAPALLLLGLFVVWPMARAVVWSFSNAGLLQPESATHVGGLNYSDLISDPRFRRAFLNTALFAVMVVPTQSV